MFTGTVPRDVRALSATRLVGVGQYRGGEIESSPTPLPSLESHQRLPHDLEVAVGAELRRQYEQGNSINNLASLHGYSIARVRRYLSLASTPLRQRGKGPHPTATKE